MNYCSQYDKIWKVVKWYKMPLPSGWKQNIFCVDRDFIRVNVEANSIEEAEDKVSNFIYVQIDNKRKIGKPMYNMWIDKISRKDLPFIKIGNDAYIREIDNYTTNYELIKIIPAQTNWNDFENGYKIS